MNTEVIRLVQNIGPVGLA